MAFVTVEGSVERVFFDGKGLTVVEEFQTKEGEQKTRKWTVWFADAPGLDVGATGQFVGSYSDKLDEFVNEQGETVRFVARTLNGAKVKPGAGHTLSRPVETKATGWASPAPVDSAPF